MHGLAAASWSAIGGDDEEIVSHHMTHKHEGSTQSKHNASQPAKQHDRAHAASAAANGNTSKV